MIVAAVVCPHPPLLLRELCGEQDAVPRLRAACHEALAAAFATSPKEVLVVGGGQSTRRWETELPVDVHSFGTTDAPRVEGLPQSLGVGKRLLQEAGWHGATRLQTVRWDAPAGEVAETARSLTDGASRAVLLVLGDGSARRGEKAPGYLDERAFAFDDGIGQALAEGDAAALAGLDPLLAAELMVLGRAAFGVLGEVVTRLGGSPCTRVLYRGDPYGVMYTVAFWGLSRA